jgi:peptide chain release factor 1
VTDHRIGFTTMNLQNVMDGERLDTIIDALRKQHEVEVMQELLEDADDEERSWC